MLRLNEIVKHYYVANETVEALKGVSINFRKKEFVSILGPSGCGKTTLLNIIGGLDQYTSGDLVISGKSTKQFKDGDWDSYRNHRIGFVFQTYNLIPHQTVLANVELALTIAGMSKEERIKKAKAALDSVGLQDKYDKKPNQLSGGQCQRVAIARAIVNDPEILLADEPTGALDTKTSIQIMDIIKEISKDRLVIMVTHNPELAEKYSTRIVRLLDGNITDDSNPFSEKEEEKELAEKDVVVEEKKSKRVKMSLWTAMKLSAKNLYSKFRRTMLVVIAGSIGIIGVASVLSVSTGVKGYINDIQDDLLSGNPITIEKSGVDVSTIMGSSSFEVKKEALEYGNYVNIQSIIEYLVSNENALKELVYQNDITYDYINYIKSMPKEYYNDIMLSYGIDVHPAIYTKFEALNEGDAYSNYISLNAITETYTAMLEKTEYEQYSTYITALTNPIGQGIADHDYINSQYDLLAGSLPENKYQILLVLDNSQALTDLALAQLGLVSQKQFYNWIYKSAPSDISGEYKEELDVKNIPYEDIFAKDFYWFPNDLIYQNETSYGTLKHYDYQYEMDPTWEVGDGKNQGIKLTISGIVKPKDNISYGALPSGKLIFSEELAREMISRNIDSKIVKYAKENSDRVITGVYKLSEEERVNVGISYELAFEYEQNIGAVDDAKVAILEDSKNVFVFQKATGIMATFMSYISQSGTSSGITNPLFEGEINTFSTSGLGGSYLPSKISIYPVNFANKFKVTAYLDEWNNLDGSGVKYYDYKEDLSNFGDPNVEIKYKYSRESMRYSDNVEVIINMINRMIDIVTYALIVFTSIALVVSTVMIGIITYVSVVERVKEIGVIRSLGGRKRDVANLFNVETFIIGFASGIFGMLITILLSFIGNVIVKSVSDGQVSMIAHVTFKHFAIMIILSVALTLISGIIPALSAARKNPVDALRSE